VRSPGAAGRPIIGRPAVTAFAARAAAIAMLVPAAAAAAVPAAATGAATATDPGGEMVSSGPTAPDSLPAGSDAAPGTPVPDTGPPAAPAQGDGSPPGEPAPSPSEQSATGTPEAGAASDSVQSPARLPERPQGATGDLPAGTVAQAASQSSYAPPAQASPASVPVASAQNTSVIYQAVWQVQKGCQAYCYGTSQVQSASQSSTTHQSATATGGGTTQAGAVAVNVAGTVQFVFQTQLGCIAFCFTTSQAQSTSQTAQTTQSATATGETFLTALNVAETFQFVWQFQQGCEVECYDASSTQSTTQQQTSQSAGTPYRPFDGPQTFLAWIAVIAANNAATVQSIFQYDEALCLERCTGDTQVQDAVLTATTNQRATAAVGDYEATKEPPGAPSPTNAGDSSAATHLMPAAAPASPVASASAAAPRTGGADRPAVGAPGAAVTAVVGSSPARGPSSRHGRVPRPAASPHALDARAAQTTGGRSPARPRASVLAGAATSHASPASSHARRIRSARARTVLRPVALDRVQGESRGPGIAWLVAGMGLLIAFGGGFTARSRAHRFCTGFSKWLP
jgi:hypothetical protein